MHGAAPAIMMFTMKKWRKKRRRAALATGFCLSFLLGTVTNVLLIPGFESQQSRTTTSGTSTTSSSGGGGGAEELRRQIRDRRSEVFRYRAPIRRRLMDLQQPDRVSPYPGAGLPLGCRSIDNVSSVQYLGSGYTKAVYRAELNGSLSVALKSVDFTGHDMESCVRRFASTRDCYRLASYKIIKEMTLMERLRHPNVLKLYGACYQDSSDIHDTVTAITELGSPLEMIQLLQTSWEERFRICLSLVRLLHYLAHSPLGSVTLLDFRPRQFVLVQGELKVTDLDDASAEETACSTPADCVMEFPARNFTLPCHRGRCQGINEKRNLYNAYRFFFTYLLPHSAPLALRPLLDEIVNSTGELVWGVDQTLSHLEKVLDLYRSGQYLQNSSHAHTNKYKAVSDMSVVGEDYRCWPSYQHEACLLSVFSIQEAMDVCESHAQCWAFITTNQTTWTGHQLILFKTGSDTFCPAPGRVTFVRVVGG